MTGSVEVIRERHETFANITMYVMIVASLLRIFLVQKGKAESKAALGVYILYLIGVISVGYTGMLGGTMVFNYMIGL